MSQNNHYMETQLAQQVNLYLDDFKQIEPPYSARFMQFITVYSLVLSLLISALFLILNWSIKSEVASYKKDVSTWTHELKLAKIEFPEPQINAIFPRKISSLKEDVKRNKKVLTYLTSRQLQAELQSFSILLLALTWVNQKDLWLTDIRISKGGANLSLTGRALNADALPSYLKKLANLDVFSELKFKVFEMDRDGDQFVFTVSSEREGGQLESTIKQISTKT